MKKTIFSGIQPTGNVHLGNYMGAIASWVELQNNKDYTNIYCIVDLHAITIYNNPAQLYNNCLDTLALLLACGIDGNNSLLFLQSQNPHHSELAWILNCVARMGWLNRMTQFKDKSGKNKENNSVGLYTYPNLMAADILLYNTNIVPVGEDQVQHVELARDIATKFNHDYENIFSLPEVLIKKNTARIMSLKDATKKMSKSDESSGSKILFSDSDDEIIKKISKAQTDTLPMPQTIQDLDNRLQVANLFKIYQYCYGIDLQEVIQLYKDKNFATFKKDLSSGLINLISPIREKQVHLLKDKAYLLDILKRGKEKSIELSYNKLYEVKKVIGLIT